MDIQTGYLERVYNVGQFKRTVKRTIKALRKLKKKTKFDSVAFRGSSGAAMAFIASNALNVPLVHVRKGSSHCIMSVEGRMDAKRIVIVDDFVDRGGTVRAIIKTITRVYRENDFYEVREKPKFVGLVLYASGGNGRCDADDVRETVGEKLMADTQIVML